MFGPERKRANFIHRGAHTRRRHDFESLEQRVLLDSHGVLISEFMASNQDTIRDAFGNSSDWIEVWNSTSEEVDLGRWSLTDDPTNLTKWIVPLETKLGADERLVVWASAQNTVDDQGELHANFKLKASGDYLALVDSHGAPISAVGNSTYPAQRTDVSFGIYHEDSQLVTSEWRYLTVPTPGEPNGSGVIGFTATPEFTVDAGFFDEPFSVELTSATTRGSIAYTLDGSTPSPANGTTVTAAEGNSPKHSLTISATTTLRTMAFRESWEPTSVETRTYLFLKDVIEQDGNGLPNTWGHAGADYEMDQEITLNSRYRDSIEDGLKSIPSLSLVTELDNWFGLDGKGIYPSGQGSPRPVSVELLNGDGSPGFQVDGSVEIQGGSSTNRWKSDKLSMQLKFKRSVGDAKLVYPLYGESAADTFDTLILDARLNQAWHYGGGVSPTSQRNRAQYTRDQFAANLQMELGGRAPSGRWVHLYLNGIYWGIHNLHERPDEHFAEAYFGGMEADYDVIKHNNDVVNGSSRNYQRMLGIVNGDMSIDASYRIADGLIDVDALINYMLMNFYVGNTDWAHHNWYATYNRVTDTQWRFHSWDVEHSLEELRDDATRRDDAQGPTHIHRRLMLNEEYRLRFMDAVQDYFFNGGKLTPASVIPMYEERADEVYEALVPESARWGDNQRTRPYTRDIEWIRERDRLLEVYFPRRSDIVVSQLRNSGFFHDFDAPRFSQHGGDVDSGSGVTITNSRGATFYTTDGTDPRTSETAIQYVTESAIVIEKPTTIRMRSVQDDEWSAIVQADFSPALVGDFDKDGGLDVDDLDQLFAATRSGGSSKFDLTSDEQINHGDVTFWLEMLVDTRTGDLNLDGRVDFVDFLVVSNNFGRTDATWRSGDVDGDQQVTFPDFLALAENFGFNRG